MNPRVFNWSLVAIGALVPLSIPEATGALMGAFFGFGLAFFVAAPSWALGAALDHYGLTVEFKELLVGWARVGGERMDCLRAWSSGARPRLPR